MADLINSNDRSWKMDIVREIFTEEDATIITSIPLSNRSIPDKLIWRDSSLGLFTVKSTYFAVRSVLGKNIEQHGQRKLRWKIMPKARVLPKIKYFVWILVHDIIPIGEILQRKGLDINHSCAACGRLGETVKHVFIEYMYSQAVWTLCAPKFNQV